MDQSMSAILGTNMTQFFILFIILSSFLFEEGNFENADPFHSLMTREELLHYFEVSEPHLVQAEHYELATVLGESPLHKRDGGSADHDHMVSLSVFGRSYSLALIKNREILAEGAEVILLEEDGKEQPVHVGRGDHSCHYQVSEYGRYLGGFSNCGEERRDYSGFFKDGKHTYEVMKLRPRLKELVKDRNSEGGNVHLVRYTSGREIPANATGTTTKERLRRLRALEDKIKISAGKKLDLLGQIEDKLEERLRQEEEEDQQQQEKEWKEPQEQERQEEELHDYVPKPRQNYRTRELLRPSMSKRLGSSSLPPLVIEIAVFFDCAATKTYLEFYENKATDVIDFMLSLVNAMQSLFNFPSLGRTVILVVTFANLEKKCKIEVCGGERECMLKSFCKFQKKTKAEKEKKWDVALLMSGIDMYGMDGYRKSLATMGLSTVTGTCEEDYECVIGEVGVRDPRGIPYPSGGYLAAYVMVHELCHNVGMPHDATQNSCSAEGGIMSPTRGTAGESEWSRCSREFMKKVKKEGTLSCLFDTPIKIVADHDKFGDAIGMTQNADEQCKVLMRDRNAKMDLEATGGFEKVCIAIVCKSTRRTGYQSAGPALPGTSCGGGGLSCYEGICGHHKYEHPPKAPEPPKWSEWSKGPCKTPCIEGASPVMHKHRFCTSFSGCQGSDTEVELCKRSENDCPLQRSTRDFATLMCLKFKKVSGFLDRKLDGEGKMVKYNKRYPKRVCAIHCLAKGTADFFAPILEFENTDLDGYSPNFPDGTLCHSSRGNDFYCMDGVCQSSSSGRGGRSGDVEDPYNVILTANPDKDQGEDGDGELNPFFMTNEDGSPKGDPPTGSKVDSMPQVKMGDDQIPKWKPE